MSSIFSLGLFGRKKRLTKWQTQLKTL
jgi:hypothetical protein